MKRKRVRHIGLALGLLVWPLPLQAQDCGFVQNEVQDQSDVPDLVAVPVLSPLAAPWSIAFLPDGTLLVTERPGRLQLKPPGAEPRVVSGTPEVFSPGHGGLMEIAVDPNFAANRTVYLSYTHGDKHATTLRVMRAKLDVANARLSKQRVIFESDPPASQIEQIGGRLLVTADGYLFLTLGDRQVPQRAQDLSDHAGSIIRIRTDGTVPEDNPFVSQPGMRSEIWSYGHRNPQGLALDPDTGDLWAHEHGPQGGDEINLIAKGRNYGWPTITYGIDYNGKTIGMGTAHPGMEQPRHYWVPSIAPSGLALERNADGLVLWVGALAGQMLVRLELSESCVKSEQRYLKGALGRIRDVRISPQGEMYLLTDGPEETLYRLEPPTEVSAKQPASRAVPAQGGRM